MGSVPGVYKLSGALRDRGFVERVGGALGGVVVPRRYRVEWDGRRVRNGPAIAAYSVARAARLGAILESGAFPIVLGGDCSILLGNMLALRARGVRASAAQTVSSLMCRGVHRFWVHLDLDVLDAAVLPAVDSPEPHGLDYGELHELLIPLLRSATGLEVTIFDPDLDDTGEHAEGSRKRSWPPSATRAHLALDRVPELIVYRQ